jgi:hypothetical protein
MTTAEMIAEVQAALGNRTDFAAPNPGYGRIVGWLNWAQYELCGYYRQRMFPPKRFHILEGDKNFELAPYYIDQTSGYDTTLLYMILDSPSMAFADAYNDAVVTIGTDEAIIVDYDQVTARAYVYPNFSQVWPSGTKYTIRSKKVWLPVVTGLDINQALHTVERLETADEGSSLNHVAWNEIAGISPKSIGTPSKFARRGNTLIFDSAPEESVWLRMYYRRYPTRLLTAFPALSSELPEIWHECIIAGAIYRGFENLMEPARATEKKASFVDMAINRRDDYEVEQQYQKRRMKVRMK